MLVYVTSGGVSILMLIILIFTFGLKVFAFADAVLRPSAAFPAAGKLTKLKWSAIVGVALLFALVIRDPISLLNIIGTIAAIVYLVDVRPALRALGPGGSIGGPKRGGGGPSGW